MSTVIALKIFGTCWQSVSTWIQRGVESCYLLSVDTTASDTSSAESAYGRLWDWTVRPIESRNSQICSTKFDYLRRCGHVFVLKIRGIYSDRQPQMWWASGSASSRLMVRKPEELDLLGSFAQSTVSPQINDWRKTWGRGLTAFFI